MSVFERITREIHAGMTFHTPVQNVSFTVYSIDAESVVFLAGAKTLIPIPKSIWNDIPDFLRNQGSVRIGARRNVALRRTLQDYIDHHPSRGTQHSADANYVASVLEFLKIVDVKHGRPSEVRLR
jgi:hypothetical protein